MFKGLLLNSIANPMANFTILLVVVLIPQKDLLLHTHAKGNSLWMSTYSCQGELSFTVRILIPRRILLEYTHTHTNGNSLRIHTYSCCYTLPIDLIYYSCPHFVFWIQRQKRSARHRRKSNESSVNQSSSLSRSTLVVCDVSLLLPIHHNLAENYKYSILLFFTEYNGF